MLPFDFQLPTRIVFGPDRIDSLGQLAGELGARRALVVSDAGVVAAGHVERGLQSLRHAGFTTALFDAVRENPTTDDVEAGLHAARRFRPDLLIGLGGGSAMDCAKGINFLYTNGGQMRDYQGSGKAPLPMLPMIAVPTTAGTGSEVQSFALISDPATHMKMACGDKKAASRIALLDPKLTVTQPPRVTALTGIDALAHAVETYVSRRRNALSMAFSRQAWRLLARHFARVLNDPQDLAARAAMQLGACLAGLAIETSMLGAAHALANPLTARYGLAHGQAVAIMLPHVIRFNAACCAPLYAELIEATGSTVSPLGLEPDPESLAEFIGDLTGKAGLAVRLSECGVAKADFETLASAAAKQWTAAFNPREVSAACLAELYRRAW